MLSSRSASLIGGAPASSRSHGRGYLGWAVILALALAAGAASADEDGTGSERELKPIGQVRVRPEFRDNANFDSDLSDRQKFFGQRTRLGLDAKLNPKLGGRILVQDTRYWGVDEGPNTASTGTERQATDLFEGYIDVRWIWDLPLDFRLGRQTLSFGRERLIGELDWSNSARTFDSYKLRFTMGAFVLDVFSAKLVDTNTPRPDTTQFYSDQDRNFSALYITREGERVERADVYWLRDIDKTRPTTPGEIKRHTIGGMARVRLPAHFAVEGEYAYQTGTAGSAFDIAAQMLTAELHYSRRDLRELKIVGGFDWATGDSDPTDDKLKTFNQLFPTGHKFLGLIDYVGRQNIRDYRAQLEGQLVGAIDGQIQYHWFQLDQPEDAWYNAAGGINQAGVRGFAPNRARTARNLGSEIDVVFRFGGIIDQLGLDAGYSHFFPGDVVGSDGGPEDGSDWAYLQFSIDI